MFARLLSRRKALSVLGALAGIALSACAPLPAGGPSSPAPAIQPGAPVRVALLVPAGSGNSGGRIPRQP